MADAPNADSAALGQCILDKTTGGDRILVARWMAASLAMAPQMDGLIAVDAKAKQATDREMGGLFTRIFTVDCRPQAAKLLKAGDRQGVESAGGKLGQMAMRELMSDPRAMAALMAYMNYVDSSKIAEIAK
ncbi:MAG: hypothetical protein IE921_06700 [Rhodobacteraceae bacterium]|nr:hypothetical protein [Paracoccaceae bacterium]